MSATGLDVFDTTLHKTHRWLNELMEVLGWQDRRRTYLALRATLHALRDRLTVEEQFLAKIVDEFGADDPIDDVQHVLPSDIRDLWPRAA